MEPYPFQVGGLDSALWNGISWVVILLGKKYAFELKIQSQSLLNYRLYLSDKDQNYQPLLCVAIIF